MKLSKSLSYAGIVLLLTLFSSKLSYAVHEKYSDFVKGDLTGQQIHLTDQRYSEMNTGNFLFKNEKVSSRIILSIDQSDKTFQAADYTATVVVTGTYYTYDGTKFNANTISATMTVNYLRDGTAYTDKNIFNLPGAHKIDLSVVSSTITPAGATANLKLTSEIDIDRFYDLDLTVAPANLTCTDLLLQSGEIEFNWASVANAEEYDLEWAYVNDYSTTGTSLPENEIEVEQNLFKFNSTRVTTQQTHYKIPYIYDRGYILYRVRAIGRSSKNNYASDMEGAWTFDPFAINCNLVSCFQNKFFSGTYAHQNNLNWQFTASYAEEGKSKVVLNYFDGIFRDRQSVTRINSLDKSLVGEKIYDYQNRPAIQVLPVPVNDNKLVYREMFNLNADGTKQYSSEDFDTDKTHCFTYPSVMSTLNGASNYYSPDNPNKTGKNAYIPDAQGYPFIQTEYTPDNTGRVKSVTMPGPVHQLPSDLLAPDHVTRNYYGTPNKEDLDALFGSEAGDAAHYKKNMVRDPNGQLSTTYIDPAGRTVATSLAGPAPDNLIPLNSNNITSVTVDLLNKMNSTDKKGSSNGINLEDMTIVMEKKITVPVEQNLKFNYEMQGQSYTNNCSTTVTLPDGSVVTKSDQRCYNCVYDLALSLTDGCGTEYLTDVNNSIADPTVVGQDILTAIDNESAVTCADQTMPIFPSTDMTTVAKLKPGEYSLRKVLKVNQKALDYYADQYFNNNNCLLKLDYFQNKEYAEVNFTGCITCDECKVLAGGSYDDSKYNVITNPQCEPCLTLEEYNQVIASCTSLCQSDKSTKCSGAYYAMLGDMSPGGQYGEYQESGKLVDGVLTGGSNDQYTPEKFPLSVFNENNMLPRKNATMPNWRHPSDLSYKEDDGTTESMIQLVKTTDEDGKDVYEPKVLHTDLVTADDMTPPSNLLNVKDFIQNWQPSWAKSLVSYHPEYPMVSLCGDFQDSHNFDYDWMNTAYGSINEGWKNVGSAFDFEHFDPFFTNLTTVSNSASLVLLFEKMMRKTLFNYSVGNGGTHQILSVWQVAWQTVHSSENQCDKSSVPATADIVMDEKMWTVFKSLYNSVKMKFEQKYMTYYSIHGGFYNGCIGDKSFKATKDGFLNAKTSVGLISWLPKLFRVNRSQFFNFIQPCNYARYRYYKEKQARFEAYNDVLQFEFLNNNECDPEPDATSVTLDGMSVEEPVCLEGQEAAVKESENITNLAIYKTCGQCPLTRDIQELLKALVANKSLLTAQKLSCNYPQLNDDLITAIGAVPDEDVFWANIKHTDRVEFEATLKNVSFKLRLPSNCLYDFTDFTGVCCLNFLPKPNYIGYVENGNFSMTATVVIKASDPDYLDEFPDRTKEITVEGYCTNIDIKNCTFQPVCKPSADATDIMGLLNALVLSDPDISTPALTSSTPVQIALDDDVLPASILYSTALTDNLRAVLDENIGASVKNTDWRWVASSVTGGTLTARIQDGASPTGGQCDLILYDMPVGYLYSNIISFSNIKPYSGDDHDFTITALVQGVGQKHYVHLTGDIGYFDMGTCETALPDEWNLAGGKTDRANTGYYVCEQSANAVKMLSYLNDAARNWPQFTDQEYVIVDYPAVNNKVELWMPPMSDNFFSNVLSFSDLEPDQRKLGDNYSTLYFIANANMADGTKVQVNGYCPALWMGNCFPSVNIGCPANNSVNIIMEGLNANATAGLITTNQTTINYIDSPNVPIYLSFVTGIGSLFTDIASFSNIIPNNEYLNTDGSSNQFYVIAHMKNGEINRMAGNADFIKTSTCFESNAELVKNGNFDKVIRYPGFPDKVCSNPTTCCPTTTQLMNELEFQTEHNYKYTWGNTNGNDNINSFRLIPQMYSFLPSYSGNGLTIDGSESKTTKNYTIDWTQEIAVTPYTDYDFSCLFSNLQLHGPAQLDVVMFDDDGIGYTSIFRDGASVQVGKAKPAIITTTSGITVIRGFDYERRKTGAHGEEIDTRIWYKVKKKISSGARTKIRLAVIDYTFEFMGNDFIVDNISLKDAGFVNSESGYDKSTDFLCNLPDYQSQITPPDELTVKETPCVGNLKDIALHTAQIKYDIYQAEQRVNFKQEYLQKCLDVYEKMLMTYVSGEDHYTLYYYDQAGNLVRTVPPKGVKKVPEAMLGQVNTDRINNEQTVFTEHELVSTYKYNSLNQLTAQSSPDMDDLNIKEMGQSNTGIPATYEIKGLSFTDASNGYAIANDGVNGHFYKTTDAGKTWTEITSMGVGDILAVQHLPGNIVFAIGERGLILKSDDGGSTWSQKTIDSRGSLVGMYFSTTSAGLIVEQNGRIWTTADAGETWQGPLDRLSRVIDGQVKDVSFTSATNGLVVTTSGKIYKTTDGAINWSPQNTIRANNLNQVTYCNGVAYAAGENGTILKRVLGGNWQKFLSTSVGNIQKIHVAAENQISILTADKNLWYSSDLGQNWLQKTSNVESFIFTDGQNGYAYTTSGSLLTTTNGGITWTTLTGLLPITSLNGFYASGSVLYITGTNKSMYRRKSSIDPWTLVNTSEINAQIKTLYVSEPYAYALTTDGTLWTTSSLTDDAFTMWNKAVTGDGENKNFSGMSWTDLQNGMLLRPAGMVLSTTDGGITWTTKELTGITGTLQAITMNTASIATVVGASGESWTTTDAGASWLNESFKLVVPPLNSVACTDDSHCFIAGNNGSLLKTTDGGTVWNLQNSGTSQNLNSVSLYSQSKGLAVGDHGAILQYNDDWTVASTTLTNNLYDVVNTSSSQGIAVGSQNTVVGGSGWSSKTIPQAIENLKAVSLNPDNQNQLVAVGQKGKLYRTTDGGSTWSLVNSLAPAILNATQMVNTVTGYAVGNAGEVYQTGDAGLTWKRITTAGNTNLTGLYFADVNHGMVIGVNGIAYTTSNAGDTWTPVTMPVTTTLHSVAFADASHGCIATDNGVMLTSTAGLAGPWTQGTPVPAYTGNFNKVYFVNSKLGFAVGTAGTILSSTNQGASWTQLTQTLTTDEFTDVHFTDMKIGYVIGKSGILIKTLNGGTTWENQNVPAATNSFDVMAAAEGSNLFIAGNNGGIFKVTDFSDLYSMQLYYDRLGRQVVAQNAKQYNNNHYKYSYTIYDKLNRISEVGQIVADRPITDLYDNGLLNNQNFIDWIGRGIRTEVSHTYYDEPMSSEVSNKFGSEGQQNLRNRIASITYEDADDNDIKTYMYATHYSYDLHGNVNKMIQDNPALANYHNEDAVIEYEYDLISNKITQVKYQEGKPDQFFHKYEFDADNRITHVYTSRDNATWDEDATYTYYNHGPLAREELGENKVQGVDYIYTIQGWLKGINSNTLNPNRDPGKDGSSASGNLNANIPADLFGYSLGYYTGDYKAINSSGGNHFEAATTDAGFVTDPKYNLYNGNIGHTVSAIGEFMKTPGSSPQVMAYQYDQLNRLIKGREFTDASVVSNNVWVTVAPTGNYSMDLNYDPNGNIETLQRTANNGIVMDNLEYKYETIVKGYLKNTNKLRAVVDNAPDGPFADIKQGQVWNPADNNGNNYGYDEVGNLIWDKQEDIANIEWTVSGKIKRITRVATSIKADLEFGYDASGNRIMKIMKPRNAGVLLPEDKWTYTYYTRDAQGNILSTYKRPENSTELLVNDFEIYGNKRVGSLNVGQSLIDLTTTNQYSLKIGKKDYELTNHLGNVLVTLSDLRKPLDTDGDGVIDSYQGAIVSANDYYPFGMLMPNPKNVSPEKYHFGFNGKEKDDEVKGTGVTYDYGFRIYDARIAKFLSMDPLMKKYPELTPFQFASNRPIDGIDVDGLEYLDSREARIKIIKGEVQLNVENMSQATKSERDIAVYDNHNWGENCIGLGVKISDFEASEKEPSEPREHLNLENGYTGFPKPGEVPNEIPVRTVNASSTGLPDQRFTKERFIGSRSNYLGGSAKTIIVLDAALTLADAYLTRMKSKDIQLIHEHFEIFVEKVQRDLNTALSTYFVDEKGKITSPMIPYKYQNTQDLSAIANVILSGVNTSDNKELLQIGLRITYLISNNYRFPLKPTTFKSGVDRNNIDFPKFILDIDKAKNELGVKE